MQYFSIFLFHFLVSITVPVWEKNVQLALTCPMLFDLSDNARITISKVMENKATYTPENKVNMPKKLHTFLSIYMIQVVCRVLHHTLTNWAEISSLQYWLLNPKVLYKTHDETHTDKSIGIWKTLHSIADVPIYLTSKVYKSVEKLMTLN